jgi:hypothetical protein
MDEVLKMDETTGLPETKAKAINLAFSVVLGATAELEVEGNKVVERAAKEITEDVCKEARLVRLKLVTVRGDCNKAHKKMKADILLEGRAIDGLKNAQLAASQGMEQKLMDIEKHFERIEAARVEKLDTERKSELTALGCDIFPASLGSMDDAVYIGYRDSMKTAQEAQQAALKAAEEEKEAKVQADKLARAEEAKKRKAEQRAKDAEIKRLKKESDERDKKDAAERAEREKAEGERQAKETAARKEREAEEAKRIALEAKDRADVEAQLAKERAAREKVESAVKVANEAKAKAQSEAEARAKDVAHRKEINNSAVFDIASTGVTEDQAIEIVKAIVKGNVSNVSIEY